MKKCYCVHLRTLRVTAYELLSETEKTVTYKEYYNSTFRESKAKKTSYYRKWITSESEMNKFVLNKKKARIKSLRFELKQLELSKDIKIIKKWM